MAALAGAAVLAAPGTAAAATARYHGTSRDLQRDGWGTAQICADFGHRDVRCYDDDAAFRRDAGLPAVFARAAGSRSTCPYGWACLWEDINYNGRRLQWSDPGGYDLSQYSFRDKASGYFNNRRQYGFQLIDFRTALLDPVLIVPTGWYEPWMGNQSYPRGGNWNDRIDRVQL